MIWQIVEVAVCVVETMLIVDFLGRYLGYKSETKIRVKSLVFVSLEMINLLVLPEFIQSEIVSSLVLIIISLAYSCVFLKGSIFEKIFIVLFNIVMIMVVNTLILTLFGGVLDADLNELALMRNSTRVMILVATKFFYFLCTRLMIKVRRGNSYLLSLKEWVAILAIFALTLIVGVIMFESVWKKDYNEYVLAVIAVGLIFINVITYILLHKMSKDHIQKTEMAMLQLQLSEQTERMKDINVMYNEILHIRHDIKKCINCAEVLLSQKKYIEAEQYLADLSSEKLGTIQQYVVLKSGVISAVINSELSECKRENIHIETSVSDCFDDFSEMDISILLANLFDNAIEACMKLKEGRYLIFNINLHRGYLRILMKNSIDGTMVHNLQLKTTKIDKKNHGFGIKTITEITEKYNGIHDFQFIDNEFVADIWLKNNETVHVTHNYDTMR